MEFLRFNKEKCPTTHKSHKLLNQFGNSLPATQSPYFIKVRLPKSRFQTQQQDPRGPNPGPCHQPKAKSKAATKSLRIRKPIILSSTTNNNKPKAMYTSNTLHHPQLLRLPFSKVTPKPPRSSSFFPRLRSSSDGQGGDNNVSQPPMPMPSPPQITPPETVEIRFRRGSKRKRKLQSLDNELPKTIKAATPAPKSWEEMTLSEKVMELYVGEKGLLFWLNKFAYASIFIVIGGWIFFRFVGPSLNLYQLDSPPLAPDAMFKGS